MEYIFALPLLMLIGWHVIVIRKNTNPHNITTTLWLSLESNEEDNNGIPLESAYFHKKTNISFAIVPGMELVEPGEPGSLKVIRVVFEDSENNSRGVHLQPKRIPQSEVKNETSFYIEHGWESLS